MDGQEVVFRADASLEIGTGHVIRCLTLADALKANGAHCRFVCREHPGALFELIRQHGYEVYRLQATSENDMQDELSDSASFSAHSAWLGTDWAVDADQTREALGDAPVDWLIVDHYAIDARWERELHAHVRKLMVIDDLADRSHDSDLLLDQNLGREVWDYANLVPSRCTVLAGPSYALLRPEFAALRAYSLQRRTNPEIKHLLITMGGVDKPNATSHILEDLKDCPLPQECCIKIVMGAHAPWLEQVRTLAAAMPWRTEVLFNVRDMAGLMAECDLAIGAAGSTSWERCCLGLPTLMVVLASNQRQGAAALEEAGGAVLLGEVTAMKRALSSVLPTLLDGQRLREMTKASSRVTDGRGTARVLRQMNAQDG